MKKEISDLVTWGLLAGFGGVARFLVGRLEPSATQLTRSKFWFLAMANIFVSAFAGIMGALLMSAITPDPTIQFAAAGVFGFMGQKGLETLSEKLTSKL